MADIGSTLSKYTSASELSNLLESDKAGIYFAKTYLALDGVTDDYDDLYTLINTTINGADAEIWFKDGSALINSNISTPSNIKLKFLNGGMLKPANGVTITGVNSKIEAGLYQIFDLSLGGRIVGTWCIEEVYPEWFGAVVDGVTNDSVSMSYLMDFINESNRTTIKIAGDIYASIVVDKRNVAITGGGTIYGSITIDTPLDGITQPDSSFRIDNLNFEKGADDFAIRFIKARIGKITNIDISNDFTYGIYYNESSTYSQKTAKILISKSWLRGDYGIYLSENNFSLGAADIHVGDCQFYNNITNIHLYKVDGFIESNNTLFLTGYNNESAIKERNLYVDYINWGKFGSGSNYFEAGLESIYLGHFQNTIVNNLSIAWCGQRIASSGIKLVSGDVSGGEDVISSINNITIMFPTLHGIETDDTLSDININDITVRSAGNGSYYYGVQDLTLLSHYGIYVPVFDTNQTVNINNITCPQNEVSITTRAFTKNINDLYNSYDIEKDTTIENNLATLTLVKGSKIYNLNNSNPTSITAISGTFYIGQEITLVAYNGNTTIVHNATTLALFDKKDINLQIYTSIRLMYAGSNRWVQIGGSDLDLKSSTTYNPPSLADGEGVTTTVTVTGAALGDFAMASFSNAQADVIINAWVSATDTVSVRFQNESAGVVDLASGTLRVKVIKA